jgi:copper transport protein
MIKAIARLALVALLAGAIAPAVASAHATIVSTTPGDGAVVKTEPATVSLKWSESVDLASGAVKLLDGTGKEIKTPKPVKSSPSTAVLKLPPGLSNGTYVVAWRVVSADSHPVSGAVSFSIGSPSAVLFKTGGSSSAVVRVIDAVGRGLAFFGLAVALGGAVVLLALLPGGGGGARGRRFFRFGIGALLLGTVVVVLMQGPYATGGSITSLFSSLSFTLGTRFGDFLLIRLLLAVGFGALVLRGMRVPAAVCGVALLFTWTLTDHSQTGVQTWLGVPAGTVHLASVALWFGGLLAVLALDDGVLAARFSRLALPTFGVLAVTGVYLAYRQSGALGAFPHTVFGRLLLIKTGIVVGVLALAWFSRRAVQRGGSPRRTVAGEAFLGIATLGVTAALVNTAPARVSYIDPIDKTVAGPIGSKVEVKVNPAKQGTNVVDVYLVARDGSLEQVPELTALLSPSDGKTGALNVGFGSAEPGHYVADRMVVPYPGDWTLRLQIRTSDIDESDLDLPIKIR